MNGTWYLAAGLPALTRGARLGGVGGGWLLGTLVAVATVWLALYVSVRLRKRMASSQEPSDLFRELCDAHELGRADRELLRGLATAARLPYPAAVFVNPETLRRAAAAQNEAAASAASLLARLFNAPPL